MDEVGEAVRAFFRMPIRREMADIRCNKYFLSFENFPEGS
jgi:hypothetical protein